MQVAMLKGKHGLGGSQGVRHLHQHAFNLVGGIIGVWSGGSPDTPAPSSQT